MKKLIYPDSNSSLFNSLDGVMVSVIRDTNFYTNIKKASSSAISRQLLEDCKPDKDHFLIHITAIGDDETYGFNKNADGFPKKANEKYYKTFETNANLFREHNSSSKDNRIGIIKAAAYNNDMHRIEVVAWANIKKAAAEYETALSGKPLSSSMGCFPAGTKILLSDFSSKNIEDITVEDTVITKDLNRSLVTKIFNYDYSGVLYNFKLAGYPDSFKLTMEHPVFIRRYTQPLLIDTKSPRDCPVCGKPMRYLWTHLNRTKDIEHQSYLEELIKKESKFHEEWVPASDIHLGDYVAIKIPQVTQTEFSERDLKFCRFLGYFIAEGSYIKYRGKKKVSNPFTAVQLNFNINEDTYINDVVELLHYLAPESNVTVQKRDKKNICAISMYNKDFAQEVFEACGEYAHSKQLSFRIMNLPDICIKELINSYIKGDGTYNKCNDTITFTTTSATLSMQLELLLARLGIVVNIYSRDTYYDKRGKLHSKFYTSAISNRFRKQADFIEKQEESMIDSSDDCFRRSPSFIENGFLFRKICSIEIESVEDIPVYNLEVKDDPSYIANSIVVHNCSVPADRDNISGKLSKNPSEYEPWMKRFPGKFIEEWDGKPINKWAYVHNDKPTFFDLSIVANPADRIADYLEYRFNDATSHSKLASFKQEGSYKDLNIPSALLPELLGYDLTKFGSDINIFKGDTKDMIFNSDLKVKVLDKLASIEKDFLEVLSDKDSAKQKSNVKVAYIHSTKNNVFDKNYHVEESKLDELRTLRPETLFYELKKRASVLPFNVFVDLIYGNSNQKFASEEQKNNIVKYAEIEIVPTIFSTIKDLLENDEDLPCGNSIDGLFDAGDPLEVVYDINNGATVQKIMDELGDNLSINKESKEPRIIQLTIIQADTPIEDGTESCDKFFKIKTASVNNKDTNGLSGISISNADKLTAKQLAYSYAFYKIAAISDILNDFKHINIDEPEQEMLLIDTINQNFLAV